MSNKENGFGAIEGLLILVIVGIVSFVGWYIYNSQRQANESLTPISQNAGPSKVANATQGWATFAEPKDPTTSFKYPKTWKLSDTEGVDMGDDNRNVAVTSPAGSQLVLVSTGAGIGGDCQPTEHSKVTYSKKIPEAANLYVVEWELFDGKTSIATGTDVMSAEEESKNLATLGDHPSCLPLAFAFGSTKYATAGYWFGTNHSKQALKPADKAVARQILGSLTVQ